MDVTLSHSDFKALSSGTRAKILKLLAERNHTMSEISKKLGLAAPTVKQHLDMLSGAGLIEPVGENRKWKYYALSRKGRGIIQKNDSTNILIVMAATFVALVVMLFNLVGQFGRTAVPLQAMQKTASESGIAGSAADALRTETATVPQTIPAPAGFDPIVLNAIIVIALVIALAYLLSRLSKKGEGI